jgi:hypothetical protein
MGTYPVPGAYANSCNSNIQLIRIVTCIMPRPPDPEFRPVKSVFIGAKDASKPVYMQYLLTCLFNPISVGYEAPNACLV